MLLMRSPMAAGLPVVASDIPVFAEYLQDGHSALLVRPGDAAAAMADLREVALTTEIGRYGPGGWALYEERHGDARHFDWRGDAPGAP